MSDLLVYEFEDTAWDEFCQSDDHIVPHPDFWRVDNHSPLCGRPKKHCCEVTNVSYNTENGSSVGYVDQGSEGGNLSLSRRKNTMLDKGSRSHAANGASSSADGDSVKEASSSASENTTPSVHALKNNNVNLSGNELCGNDAILGGMITDVDNNSSSDPLGGINHRGDDLNFLENVEDKDSSDFLYYGWPDIENFEDVDQIFRTCDSTFELGTGKENDLDWFSSADNVGGSGDVLNPDFKFSCLESNPVEIIPPNLDSSKSYSFNDSAMMSTAPIRPKDSPWMSEKSDSYIAFVNGPAIANDKDGFIPKTQMNEHQKQLKLLNQTKEKGLEHDFVDGHASYINKHPNEVMQLSSRTIFHHAFPSACMQQQPHTLGSDSCNYSQNRHSYTHSDNSPVSGLTSVNPTSSAIKSENNDLTSPSPRDSSRASNQLPLVDGCHRKREKLYNCQAGRSSGNSILKHPNPMVHAALDDPGSITKEAQYPGAKSENDSHVEGGSLFTPAEIGSSNIQESSTMSSHMNDISAEAASFRQLQLVMKQLDLRTKMCIRDSLYRLAWSAEQRHSHANSNNSCVNGWDASGAFMAEGENPFMNIETDTNPIDRSVAHLLFHRPSESSVVPAHDSMHPNKIRRSVTSQPLMVENLNNSGETASRTGGV